MDLLCPLCSSSIESSLHLFWDCTFAKAVWFGCLWSVRTNNRLTSNWVEWLDWFKKPNNRPATLDFNQLLGGAAIIFEHIWKVRNRIIHEGISTPVAITINLVNLRLRELDPTGIISPQAVWNPPPPPRKAVFRDALGTFRHILTFRTTQRDPLAGEVAAICEGAAAAVYQGYKNIIFQCDSLNAINALKSNPAEIHKLHFNIQDKIASFFNLGRSLNLWEVQWIPRSCNGVAHSVAQWANRNNKFGVHDLANFDDFLQQSTADGHKLS
ncbi:hypothetical protein CsatA_020894 [Cannabis sativa]